MPLTQAIPFMKIISLEKIMNACCHIDKINKQIEPWNKDVLVRIYNLNNGADVWLSLQDWSQYESLGEYLLEEFEIPTPQDGFVFDILSFRDELVLELAVNSKGAASLPTAFAIMKLRNNKYEDHVIKAAVEVGIDIVEADGNLDYCGKYNSLGAYAKELYFDDADLKKSPLRDYIDWERYAEDRIEQSVYISEAGHIFGA